MGYNMKRNKMVDGEGTLEAGWRRQRVCCGRRNLLHKTSSRGRVPLRG